MSILSTFPSYIGFDDMFRDMDRIFGDAKKQIQKSWPPYDIVKTGDNTYRISMALSGFSKSDIDVSLNGNTLSVSGHTEPEKGVEYLHKGIAERTFSRDFKLADTIEVKNCEMVNGVLNVILENQVKTLDAIKKISIK